MYCPKCESAKIRLDTVKDGFSYKKALLGSAILGPVGAVAGLNEKKKTIYVCDNCGYNSDTPFPSGMPNSFSSMSPIEKNQFGMDLAKQNLSKKR